MRLQVTRRSSLPRVCLKKVWSEVADRSQDTIKAGPPFPTTKEEGEMIKKGGGVGGGQRSGAALGVKRKIVSEGVESALISILISILISMPISMPGCPPTMVSTGKCS